MKTDAPETLSLTTQPLYMGGRLFMGCTAWLAFDLFSGEAVPPPQAFAVAMQSLANGECLDMGAPKVQAEWLAAGKAYSSDGNPVTRAAVSISVGSTRRRLLAESAKPFSEFALNWDAAWGSAEENPDGITEQRPKASVSDVDMLARSPACFAPRGAWPCRMQNMGTYDESWLKENWPSPPNDFDWGFYNLSQPSQRLANGIKGDEKILIEGMNKDCPRIESRIPRTAVTFRFTTPERTFEKTPEPDTLWLFPEGGVAMLLWHAVAESLDEAGAGIDEIKLIQSGEEAVCSLPRPEEAEAAEETEPQITVEMPPEGVTGSAFSPDIAEGLAGAGAGATVAAAQAEAGGKNHEQDEQAAAPQADQAPQPDLEGAAQDAPEPETNLRADMMAELEKSLPEINQAMVQSGLPPLTPEQVDEVKDWLTKIADETDRINAEMKAAEAKTPEDILKENGLSDADITTLKTALDIPVPNVDDFADQASWDAAVSAYADKFGAVMGADEKVVKNMKTVFGAMHPDSQPKSYSYSTPGDEKAAAAELLTKQLIDIGMSPTAAANMTAVLSDDTPLTQANSIEYGKRIEQAAGFPEGSVTGWLEAIQPKEVEILEEIKANGGEVPDDLLEELTGKAPEKAPEIEPESEKAQDDLPKAQQPEEAKESETPQAPQEPEDAEKESGEPKAEITPRESVLSAAASGESLNGANLDGLDLSSTDLSGADLQNASLVGTKLENCRLTGANLSGANLSGALLAGTILSKAKLSGANLSGADASSCDFVDAELDGANLSGLTAVDADFSGANLASADLSGANLSEATFERTLADGVKAANADLSRARISYSRFDKGDFSGAKLQGTDVHCTSVNGANFAAADLQRSTFCYGTTSQRSNFAKCDMTDVNWTKSSFDGADFSAAVANNATFSDCELRKTRWNGVDAKNGDFSRSLLEGAEMRRANLFKGSLREARLGAADLSESNLFGADMCRAFNVESANLRNADCGQTIIEARSKA